MESFRLPVEDEDVWLLHISRGILLEFHVRRSNAAEVLEHTLDYIVDRASVRDQHAM